MKKFFKRVAILFLVLMIFILARGFIYRSMITYKQVGERSSIPIGNKLALFIDNYLSENFEGNIESIISLSQQITSDALEFSLASKKSNPNNLYVSKKSNCIGYARFTAATANYLIDKYKLSDIWEANPVIGKLYLLGVDVHPYLSDKMFRDHDFVIFRNKKTNQQIAVDPTVSDYFMIDKVSTNK